MFFSKKKKKKVLHELVIGWDVTKDVGESVRPIWETAIKKMRIEITPVIYEYGMSSMKPYGKIYGESYNQISCYVFGGLRSDDPQKLLEDIQHVLKNKYNVKKLVYSLDNEITITIWCKE